MMRVERIPSIQLVLLQDLVEVVRRQLIHHATKTGRLLNAPRQLVERKKCLQVLRRPHRNHGEHRLTAAVIAQEVLELLGDCFRRIKLCALRFDESPPSAQPFRLLAPLLIILQLTIVLCLLVIKPVSKSIYRESKLQRVLGISGLEKVPVLRGVDEMPNVLSSKVRSILDETGSQYDLLHGLHELLAQRG